MNERTMRRAAQRRNGKAMGDQAEVQAEPQVIALPARTRAILEAKLKEQATLQALLQQQGQAIQELIAGSREKTG